jgi:hypothetical protein
MDAMDNEEALRLLVQRKLRDGLLPHDRVSIVWSGPSAGETCDACDVSLTKHQLLMEGTQGRETPPVYFHVQCFRVWDHERRAA